MNDLGAQRQRWASLFYPETHTLRNEPGIRDGLQWSQCEADLTAMRAHDLPPGGFGKDTVAEEIAAVHHHLFQDCYAWAGTFRRVNIGKEETVFAPYDTIEARLAELDSAVAALDATGYDAKLELLAYMHSELNQVHPFYEGNGRTTRATMEAIAARHDIAIEWGTNHQALHEASRQSMAGPAATWMPFLNVYRQVCQPAVFDDLADMPFDEVLAFTDRAALTEPSDPPLTFPESFQQAINTMHSAYTAGQISSVAGSDELPVTEQAIDHRQEAPEL